MEILSSPLGYVIVDDVLVLKRLLGAVLVLIGLTMLALGTWFAVQLGSSGTATFTAQPLAAGPLIIEPSVLNRTDLPVRITVSPKAGERAVVAVGTPSDASAALAASAFQAVRGIAVREWTALTEARGSGPAPDLAPLDVWRSSQQITEETTVTVRQDSAPETVVIAPATGSTLDRVTLSWSNSTWFYQALVVAGSGLILATVGALMFRPTKAQRLARHSSTGTVIP